MARKKVGEEGHIPLSERGEASLTPLQKQYLEIKKEHQGQLLLFRLGDFYELFDEDAVIASRELDLTLTTRDRGKPAEEQVAMCGVPFHSADSYIARLLQRGYKVAVCEQMEDPALAKGLVKREVVRIITPGTITDASMLENGRANYICAVYLGDDAGAAAFCDVSTGEFAAVEYPRNALGHLMNELGSFSPSEAILSGAAAGRKQLTEFLLQRLRCSLEQAEEARFDYDAACARVLGQFKAEGLAALGLESKPNAVRAAGALLSYISETQKRSLDQITAFTLISEDRFMELDWNARRSLELTKNQRSGQTAGSLLWALDYTSTPMGARLLRSWVEQPLLSLNAIRRRLNAVSELAADNVLRGELMESLSGIRDMSRAVSRAACQSANGRDLIAIGSSCERLPKIRELLAGARSSLLSAAGAMDDLGDIRNDIFLALDPDPPMSIREGGILRRGYSEEAERLRSVHDNAAQLIADLEARERARTGIKKLRVGYNRAFGYYIDLPASAGSVKLPDEYIRKQTLANNERYITAELKSLEAEIFSARERICEIEYRLFCELRARVAGKINRVQDTSDTVAELDAVCSLAEAAVRNGYVCPEVDDSGEIDIREGRHPVVELMQKDTRFVPNDTRLNCGADRLAIITGPNMAGKSTYMRQTALIVLMAQMGSFVPAKSATIGIVDRVFTRIGASDDLTSGQSTFMLEMSEVASILKNATKRSLILLDEIGRGTSTYDGIAIARAVLEFCADRRRLGAKTMLATHYHELTALEGSIDGVRNYYITARKQGGGVIFLRRIVRGAAEESYGIEVAALAGVPASVVSRARACLEELSAHARTEPAKAPEPEGEGQLSFASAAADEVVGRLRSANIEALTPIEAMNLLYELQRKLNE